jgi:long-chain-fatty-acid--CoA ligase ACSBG
VINEKTSRQKPGECAVLIYTSGTTGHPKGCMLSHDNCVWEQRPVIETLAETKPEINGPNNRIVSYLPLSHIAGLSVDVLTHYLTGHEVYFARPDALQGTIVQTLTWARPTMFFAVPRVWEKFEEKLKEIAASKPGFMQAISGWAKGHGAARVAAVQ